MKGKTHLAQHFFKEISTPSLSLKFGAEAIATDEGKNEQKWHPTLLFNSNFFKKEQFLLTLYNVIDLWDPHFTDIFIITLKCYPYFTQLPVFSFTECKQSETNKLPFFGWIPRWASFCYPCTNDVWQFQWSCWYVVNLAVWIWVQNTCMLQTWFTSKNSFHFLRQNWSLLQITSHPNSCPFWRNNSLWANSSIEGSNNSAFNMKRHKIMEIKIIIQQ